MNKFFKQNEITLSNYLQILKENNKKSDEEILKEAKENYTKEYFICNGLKKKYNDINISMDTLNSLKEIFSIEQMKQEDFNDKLIETYELVLKYPMLLPNYIKDLLPFYNPRMFTEFNLFEILDRAVETKIDIYFEVLLSRAVVSKINYDDKWKNASSILDSYKGLYSDSYIEYLKEEAIKNYIDFEEIIASMPSSELVNKDEKLVNSIENIYKLNIIPISYKLTIAYAAKKDLSEFKKISYITPDDGILTSFKFSNYLDDIRAKRKTIIK